MRITIPKLSLVVLIGPSGSGKSTFARRHFLPTEVLSSDACRGMVSDDEGNQAVTNEAFEVLHFIAARRLALGRLTVIDATNVQPEAHAGLISTPLQAAARPAEVGVLNAFRHHGDQHVIKLKLHDHQIGCSTPFGIMEISTRRGSSASKAPGGCS